MKSRIFLLALFWVFFVSLGFISCYKGPLVKANINEGVKDNKFAMDPLIAIPGLSFIASFDVYMNVDSLIKANNASLAAEYITSVKFLSCVMKMEDGDGFNNFSSFQYCKVELASDNKPEFVTIGEINNNPDVEAYTLDFPVNQNVNLKDYFKATHFTYRLTGVVRKPTLKRINCSADIRVNIQASY